MYRMCMCVCVCVSRQGECKFAALGCEWVGAVDERDAHEAACPLATLTGEQILGLLRAKSSAGGTGFNPFSANSNSSAAGVSASGSGSGSSATTAAGTGATATSTVPVAVVRPCLPPTTQGGVGALVDWQSPTATIKALQNALELFSSDRVALIGILSIRYSQYRTVHYYTL